MKLRQIIKLCNKYEAILILAGDIFDSPTVGHKVVNVIIQLLGKLKTKCIIVPGQHDQVNHLKDLEASPLFTLHLSKKIEILHNRNPYNIGYDVYGSGFGTNPVGIERGKNILVIHKSITPEKPPFFLPDAISAKEAFKKYDGYQYIISGDYHVPFIKKVGKRLLINCGSMMRENVDQIEHKPRVYLLDLEKNRAKPIFLKIENYESVFALDMVKKKEASLLSDELGELVDVLKESNKRPDFIQTVKVISNSEKVGKKVIKKTEELIEEAKYGNAR
jgi:DNA repair exonuclease SbcCD nuclease subunit